VAPIIRTERLSKTFARGRKDAVEAVRQIDLEVGKGEIFGLLGPNGAGKSTVMRMLCTLLIPTSGSATIAGFELGAAPGEIRKRIGYVGQKGGLEQSATGRENLMLHAQLYRMSGGDAARRVDALIERLGLSSFVDRRAETYSGGQRRILDLASGLINAPELLFLDEPTTGLDPKSRARVWEEVRAVQEQGTTVFLTTHYLEEADALCGRVAIVDLGRLVALGSPAELKKQIAGDIVTLGYDDETQMKAARQLLDGNPLVRGMQDAARGLQVLVDQGEEALPPILRIVGQGNCPARSVHLSRPSLDDVFLKLTGRSLQEPDSISH